MNQRSLILHFAARYLLYLHLMHIALVGKNAELVRILYFNNRCKFILCLFVGATKGGSINCFRIAKTINADVEIFYYDLFHIGLGNGIRQGRTAGCCKLLFKLPESALDHFIQFFHI